MDLLGEENSFSSRKSCLKKLETSVFDILVIGGGATGAGIALDASCRGLNVALVEAEDFSSGASSRSTKLIHGGLRYLEKACKNFDYSQYCLVSSSLEERSILFKIAPHIVHLSPILIPVYSYLELSYYFMGLKFYDWISGKKCLKRSVFLKKKKVLKKVPSLKKEGLKGAILYYDGQFDDSRMNVSLIVTSSMEGACTLNYAKVTRLLKDEQGRLIGAKVKDCLTENSLNVMARVIINATGPMADCIRKMDNGDVSSIIEGSSGTHVILDKEITKSGYGILIPKTEDDRLLFLLPWQNGTLLGTTDNPCEILSGIKPTREEVEYLLKYFGKHFEFTEDKIFSAWSGIRPLLKNSHVTETSCLSRDHFIECSSSGLLSITGGKWTIYRKMAEEVVNRAIEMGNLDTLSPCITKEKKLIGACDDSQSLAKELNEEFSLEEDIAKYWSQTYGTRSYEIVKIFFSGYGDRIVPAYPYTTAELIYALRYEYVCTAHDFLARRIRLAFLNQELVLKALSIVVAIMADFFSWSDQRAQSEVERGERILREYKPNP